MAIEIIAGPVRERANGGFARETLNHSTSTVPQTICLDAALTRLSTATGGTATATGFLVNVYSLSTASAVEGQEKAILMTGTGEAKILHTGTSTGALVLNAADDYVVFKMHERKWRLWVNSGATIATST